jgi:hypothetical protein
MIATAAILAAIQHKWYLLGFTTPALPESTHAPLRHAITYERPGALMNAPSDGFSVRRMQLEVEFSVGVVSDTGMEVGYAEALAMFDSVLVSLKDYYEVFPDDDHPDGVIDEMNDLTYSPPELNDDDNWWIWSVRFSAIVKM